MCVGLWVVVYGGSLCFVLSTTFHVIDDSLCLLLLLFYSVDNQIISKYNLGDYLWVCLYMTHDDAGHQSHSSELSLGPNVHMSSPFFLNT